MDKLVGYIDELVVLLKSGAQFATDQLPSVVQESMAYWTTMATIGFWTTLVILVLTILSCIPTVVLIKNNPGDEWGILFIPIAVVFITDGLLFALYYAPQYLMATTAPKLFLISKLAEFLQ